MLIWALKKTVKVVRQSIILSLLFYVALVISLFLFYIFYNWYLPKAKYERTVDFELQNAIYRQSGTKEIVYHELVANVNLFDKIGETLHYGQEYSIYMVLDVPESDNNFDIGMFGISVDVIDADNRKSITLKTMGTLIYKSALLRYLTTLFYFPYYIFGRFEQKQTITLSIKDNFIDNAYMPANKLFLRIHDKLQYYSVNLVVEAKFSGLKYCLHRWFYTTSFILCSCLTTLVYLAFLTSFYDLKSMLFFNSNEATSKSDEKYGLKAISYTGKDGQMEFTGDLSNDSFMDSTFKSDLSKFDADFVEKSKNNKWFSAFKSFDIPNKLHKEE